MQNVPLRKHTELHAKEKELNESEHTGRVAVKVVSGLINRISSLLFTAMTLSEVCN